MSSRKRPHKPPPPGRKADMRVIEVVFILSVMFEMGIVPIDDVTKDVSRALDNVSPEEARTKKRKFRKLWRQAAADCKRRHLGRHGKGTGPEMLGMGKHNPSRKNMLERKRLVFETVWYRHILPMLTKFNEDVDT